MTTLISWGDPPEDGKDMGKMNIAETLSNLPGSGSEGNANLYESYGMKLPLRSRVRTALRITRKYQKPFKCTIPGVGILYVGDNGWEVRKP